MDKRIGFGLYDPVGTGVVLDVYLCLDYGGVGGVCGEWVGGLYQVWKNGVMFV